MEPLVHHLRSEQLLHTVVAPDAIPTNPQLVEVVAVRATTRTPLVLQHQELLAE